MKIIQQGHTLNVSQIRQLGNAESETFRSRLATELHSGIQRIEIDLSETRFVDCGGVGALVGLRSSARRHCASLSFQVLNPSSQVRQILNLTRLETLITPRGA